MKTAAAGAAYFALVFTVGFALGVVRTLFLVPRYGDRAAELMEMPVILVVSFVAARWITGALSMPYGLVRRLAMGCFGLALMLGAEFILVLPVRGLTIGEYFATRDPVGAGAYYFALAMFALMPAFVQRGGSR
jgi:hypothetical protein